MKYLFVTGMGRSGTKFMSRVLSEVPNAAVHHEYLGDSEFVCLSWYLESDDYAIPFLRRSRRDIERQRGASTELFIDVNPGLRHVGADLKKVFDDAPVVHLVRDPRKVIPSIYVRRKVSKVHIVPKHRAEVERWLDGDRFSRICWDWAATTRHLLAQDTVLIQLEKIVSDFGYLQDKMVKPFGLSLSQEQWEALRAKKVNRTRSQLYRYVYARVKGKTYSGYQLPSYEEWTAEQRAIYEEYCGDLAEQLGYV